MRRYKETPPVSQRPKNGDLIKLEGSQALYRIMTAKHRATREMIHGTFLFNKNGKLRIAAKNYVLEPGIRIVDLRQEEETFDWKTANRGRRREERKSR